MAVERLLWEDDTAALAGFIRKEEISPGELADPETVGIAVASGAAENACGIRTTPAICFWRVDLDGTTHIVARHKVSR